MLRVIEGTTADELNQQIAAFDKETVEKDEDNFVDGELRLEFISSHQINGKLILVLNNYIPYRYAFKSLPKKKRNPKKTAKAKATTKIN